MLENREVLKMEGVTKTFPGVKALDNVNFCVRAGEVHALLGENGAGKSTLMKILSGVYTPDSGKIYLNGQEVHIKNIRHAQHLGISIIFQEINTCPDLTVADNVYIGRQKSRFGIVDRKAVEEDTQRILDRMGLSISPRDHVREMGVAKRQLVEIAKALSFDSDVIVFDEPTAALSNDEIEQLFKIILQLKDEGKAIVFISHRMEELKFITDRVTILRDGKQIGEAFPFNTVSMDQLIERMVGREITDKYPKYQRKIGEVLFEVDRIKNKKVDVNQFQVHKGEIVALTGLMGSGRTELARAIFGADPTEEQTMRMEGKSIRARTPSEAIANGIGYLTEDRKGVGLALRLDCEKNINMASIDRISRHGILDEKKAIEGAQKYVDALNIKTPSLSQLAQFLSGGNQQKLILAKWMCRGAKLLIFDEPTRGIDVGAKYEIYKLMNELSDQGVGIIMISSDLPEAISMSDRVLFMYEGKMVGEVPSRETTQEDVLQYIIGVKSQL